MFINKRNGFLVIVWALLLIACSKGSSGGGTTPTPVPPTPPTVTETKLDVKLSAGAIEIATANNYNLTVTIQSTMPIGGIDVKVEVKREDNSAVVFTNTITNTSTATHNFAITPLPAGQVFSTATVTVTSKTANLTTPNTWTGSFRVVWK